MAINIISDLLIHPTKKYATRDLSKVDTIIVHQTDGYDKGINSVYGTANYHVETKKWPGISYHRFITDDGEIYKTNNLETKSYHAGGYNERSVGVVVTGRHRFDSSKSNEEIIGTTKYKSLVNSIVNLLRELPNKDIKIISHASVSTERSDPNLDMDQLREDVKKKLSQWWKIILLTLGVLLIIYLMYRISRLG